ncbi:Integration host factor subunit alpha [Desulfamplus magnetovallimortis]|uniref:Integration host factor subunit alpha n=1 Tax=Desulfamplus magnetovallimortis TaxID=1246637 RepID=A0A1W1HF06_9BACT|nr:integration host factor subunit alpha [Desulfamplus magnetovallimortis]SLM31074.1 Integration host factor subunit alpha [Desulfamplus magnetovallimortis]
MSLTKKDIVAAITEKRYLSHINAGRAVEDLLEIIKESLESGEDVMISGFGKFCVKEKASRKGRNPATDSTMTLPARRVVTFKCAGILRDKCQT